MFKCLQIFSSLFLASTNLLTAKNHRATRKRRLCESRFLEVCREAQTSLSLFDVSFLRKFKQLTSRLAFKSPKNRPRDAAEAPRLFGHKENVYWRQKQINFCIELRVDDAWSFAKATTSQFGFRRRYHQMIINFAISFEDFRERENGNERISTVTRLPKT